MLALMGMSVAVEASALRGRPEFDLLLARQNKGGAGGNAAAQQAAAAKANAAKANAAKASTAASNNGGNNNAAAAAAGGGSMYPALPPTHQRRDAWTARSDISRPTVTDFIL